MTNAIFSLIGVVIGGLLTGAVQSFQQRRSDRAQLRAASRLLSAELSEQHVFLASLTNQDSAQASMTDLPAISAWPDYRPLMARLLDDEAWQAVARAYVELGLLHSSLASDLKSVDGLVQGARAQLQQEWRNHVHPARRGRGPTAARRSRARLRGP